MNSADVLYDDSMKNKIILVFIFSLLSVFSHKILANPCDQSKYDKNRIFYFKKYPPTSFKGLARERSFLIGEKSLYWCDGPTNLKGSILLDHLDLKRLIHKKKRIYFRVQRRMHLEIP